MAKKVLMIASILLSFVCAEACAQADSTTIDSTSTDIGVTEKEFDYRLDEVNFYLRKMVESAMDNDRYKMYQTDNIYNLLCLDTKTGIICLVQWSLESGKEGYVFVNDEDLSTKKGACVFELYPTKNMYQFILVDKSNGRMWHVQWGFESSKRWIRKISPF